MKMIDNADKWTIKSPFLPFTIYTLYTLKKRLWQKPKCYVPSRRNYALSALNTGAATIIFVLTPNTGDI
jgi:hypothetical protein